MTVERLRVEQFIAEEIGVLTAAMNYIQHVCDNDEKVDMEAMMGWLTKEGFNEHHLTQVMNFIHNWT